MRIKLPTIAIALLLSYSGFSQVDEEIRGQFSGNFQLDGQTMLKIV